MFRFLILIRHFRCSRIKKLLVLFAWIDGDNTVDFIAYFTMALTMTELMAADEYNYSYRLHNFLGLITTKCILPPFIGYS